jgi:hypothetical protein
MRVRWILILKVLVYLCFILLFVSLQGQLLEAGCRVSSHLITSYTPAPQPTFMKYLIALLMPSSSLSLDRELKPSTVTPITTRRSSTESDTSLESETSVERCGHLLPNSSHSCPENVENSGQRLENSGHGHGENSGQKLENSGQTLENSGHILEDSGHGHGEKFGQMLKNSGHGHGEGLETYGHGYGDGLETKTESNKNLRRRRFPSAISNEEM